MAKQNPPQAKPRKGKPAAVIASRASKVRRHRSKASRSEYTLRCRLINLSDNRPLTRMLLPLNGRKDRAIAAQAEREYKARHDSKLAADAADRIAYEEIE